MKVEVYDAAPKEEEQVIRLRLVQGVSSARLVAVDGCGDEIKWGEIARFFVRDGKLRAQATPYFATPHRKSFVPAYRTKNEELQFNRD